MINQLDKLFERLDALVARCVNAVQAGARAEMLREIMSEIIALLGMIVGSPIGEAARAEFAFILRRLAQDPFLTERVADYLRTRMLALEEAADQFVVLAAKSGCLHGSSDHDLPSQAELFQDRLVAHIDYTDHLLDGTAEQFNTIHLLIPSPGTVIETAFPSRQAGLLPAAPQVPALQSSPSNSCSSGWLMRLTPQAHLTRKGKAQHLASAASAVGLVPLSPQQPATGGALLVRG